MTPTLPARAGLSGISVSRRGGCLVGLNRGNDRLNGNPPVRDQLATRPPCRGCDGRHEAANSRPAKLVIADATTWPGIPVAAWPPAQPSTTADPAGADLRTGYQPPRGRGIPAIPDDTPLACWLPVKPGLTVHGLRHGHKTWVAEDGIPEILAEQRLGHEVPGMRGLYAHASARMRDDLKHALQARWEDSLRERAAICPHSPLPLLDELLAPLHGGNREPAQRPTPHITPQEAPAPGDREKMISQIPPRHSKSPAQPTRLEPVLRASDLARYQESGSGAKGTRTPDPLLAKQVLFQLSYSPATGPTRVPGQDEPVRAAEPWACQRLAEWPPEEEPRTRTPPLAASLERVYRNHPDADPPAKHPQHPQHLRHH